MRKFSSKSSKQEQDHKLAESSEQ